MLKEILWQKAGFGQGIVKPRIIRQPKSITALSGRTATVSIDATGASSYQWYEKGPSDADFSAVSGATSATYTHTAAYAEDGTQYKCAVTDGNSTATSDAVRMTVIPKELTITTQPVNAEGETGAEVTFSVAADGETPGYQWKSREKDSAGEWSDSAESGNATDTLTLEITEENLLLEFCCVVTDVDGNTVTSDIVYLIKEEPEEDEGA